MSALNGLRDDFHSGKTWMSINHDLIELLQQDSLKVKDALQMTSKLCLLYKRESSVNYTPQTIRQLRTRIVAMIPETARLAYSGINTFAKVLPSQEAPEFAFYSRVLASLGKLATEEELQSLRTCCEYLSRKKLKLPLPEVYPAPSEKDNGDPDWFLWAFYLSFYADKAVFQNVATNWKLFSWNWNKSYKHARQGLLWGMSFCIPKASYQTDFIWSSEEKRVLEQVDNMSSELWKASEPQKEPVFEFTPRTDVIWTPEEHPTSPHDFIETPSKKLITIAGYKM